MNIQIKKINKEAIIPSFAHGGDAGMDLHTLETVVIAPGGRVAASTGLAFAIPKGYVGLIWEKSGLSFKFGIKTFGGVIDSGYRGEVKVGLINNSNEEYIFKAGDKVAQMIIQKIEQPEFTEVLELLDTSRGADGFGSTGK